MSGSAHVGTRTVSSPSERTADLADDCSYWDFLCQNTSRLAPVS